MGCLQEKSLTLTRLLLLLLDFSPKLLIEERDIDMTHLPLSFDFPENWHNDLESPGQSCTIFPYIIPIYSWNMGHSCVSTVD